MAEETIMVPKKDSAKSIEMNPQPQADVSVEIAESVGTSGIFFQWGSPVPAEAKSAGEPNPLPGPSFIPTIVNLPGVSADDITVDRIQRSHRVALDWYKLVTKVFDYSLGTGFEYIRLPLEKEAGSKPDSKGNPDSATLLNISKNAGIVAGVKLSEMKFGKWVLKAKDKKFFEFGDFANVDSYLTMWREKVERIDLPLDTICSITFENLYAGEIAIRYQQIKAEVNATSVLTSKADNLLNAAVDEHGLDNSYKSSLRRAMDMKVSFQETNSRMRELQQKAEALGYRLDSDNGSIVKITNVGVSFIPAHHRTQFKVEDELGVGMLVAKLTNERPLSLRPMPDWQETKYSHEQALNLTIGLKSGLFERHSDEYVAATGHRLSDVLSQLDPYIPDSVFSTITIPVYDMGVNTGERLTRVISASRPHPGRMPIRMPELFIEEKYRLVLQCSGVAVGEVVESTTLAPGEERTLIVERSTVVERETTNSATSSLDISNEAHSEFVSELESESRRSRDATHSSNWSASTSGGVDFGVWNAGGSANGGQTWNETTNEFAKKISKLTQKASNTLAARTRYEVSSTANYKATTTTRESTTINLKNINQGCALTLFLHQLTNRYAQKLYLADLTVTVLPAVETLHASEFSLPLQFSLADVTGILKAMAVDSLPIGYRSSRKVSLQDYYRVILSELIKKLKEYPLETNDDNVSASELLDEVVNESDIVKAIALAEKNFRKLIVKKVDLTRGADLVNGPCAGLLMSTYTSPSTALESYTNSLRDAELERRNADTKEVLARAYQLEALANTVKPVPPDLAATVRNDGNFKTAIINFVGVLRTGRWMLLMDGIVQQSFEVTDVKMLEYSIHFSTDQIWLDPASANVGFLLHDSTKFYVPFVV